jgi:hypothetical protein
VIVVSFHPDNFNPMARVGELSNVPQELPMLFCKTAKIQVGKDIAQQDEPLETHCLQKSKGRARLADLRTKVQVGDNQGVNAI